MLLYILSFEINGIKYVGSIPENGYLKPCHPDTGHIISVIVHQIGEIFPINKPTLSINAAITKIIEQKSINLPRPGRYEKLIQFHIGKTRQAERQQKMIQFIKDGSYDYTSYKKYSREANRLNIKPMEKRAFISLFNFVHYKEPIDDQDYYIPNFDDLNSSNDLNPLIPSS